MSMEAMQAFYKKVQSDNALQKEAEQAVQQGPAAVVALAAREGFEFSEAEVAAEWAALAADEQELSDSDLDLVAGGYAGAWAPKTPSGERGLHMS